ncbi:MAG: helix-turn-helix domain-containing protein [Hyphomicrobiaceae bacterium]|nr:MAG: helix-turn-helix domain-containing protein [Hyphomicrobiaceae bacterium]
MTDNDGAVKIGAQLRSARVARGLTIPQLAEATGLSKGFVSQVERDKANASVASLVRICEAVGISVGSLFDPPQADLVQKADRREIKFGGIAVAEYLLTPSTASRFQVIESIIAPGGSSGDEGYELQADSEFVHVLSGRLKIRVKDNEFDLAAGDSITFSPRDAHHWINPSKRYGAHVLWVVSPPLS